MDPEALASYAPLGGAAYFGFLAARALYTGVCPTRGGGEYTRLDHPIRYWLSVGFQLAMIVVLVGLYFDPDLPAVLDPEVPPSIDQ